MERGDTRTQLELVSFSGGETALERRLHVAIVTHCEFQRHHGDLVREGRDGKCEGEKRKVRISGKGKCKLIADCANFWQGKV